MAVPSDIHGYPIEVGEQYIRSNKAPHVDDVGVPSGVYQILNVNPFGFAIVKSIETGTERVLSSEQLSRTEKWETLPALAQIQSSCTTGRRDEREDPNPPRVDE